MGLTGAGRHSRAHGTSSSSIQPRASSHGGAWCQMVYSSRTGSLPEPDDVRHAGPQSLVSAKNEKHPSGQRGGERGTSIEKASLSYGTFWSCRSGVTTSAPAPWPARGTRWTGAASPWNGRRRRTSLAAPAARPRCGRAAARRRRRSCSRRRSCPFCRFCIFNILPASLLASWHVWWVADCWVPYS